MATKYWLKLYHEILDDHKVSQLSDRLWRRTIECFLLAGDHNEKGELPSLEAMAWRLRMDSEMLESDLVELAKLGIVEQADGIWKVSKFEDRQRVRTSTERVQEYRKRHQKDYVEGWNETKM